MTTLLQINSSIFGDGGQSSLLGDQIAANWQAANPRGEVIRRQLTAASMPHLTAERFQSFLTPAEQRTPEQREVTTFSDALIDELQRSDVIVFDVALYNFNVPSTLRAYFDHIARAGITFRYTDHGPEGLIKNKKAYVVIARGGLYDASNDHVTPYLRQFLGFVGITDIEFVYAEGLATGNEGRAKGIDAARRQIEAIKPVALAA